MNQYKRTPKDPQIEYQQGSGKIKGESVKVTDPEGKFASAEYVSFNPADKGFPKKSKNKSKKRKKQELINVHESKYLRILTEILEEKKLFRTTPTAWFFSAD